MGCYTHGGASFVVSQLQYDTQLCVDIGTLENKVASKSLNYVRSYSTVLRSLCLRIALYFQSWIMDTPSILFSITINQCTLSAALALHNL